MFMSNGVSCRIYTYKEQWVEKRTLAFRPSPRKEGKRDYQILSARPSFRLPFLPPQHPLLRLSPLGPRLSWTLFFKNRWTDSPHLKCYGGTAVSRRCTSTWFGYWMVWLLARGVPPHFPARHPNSAGYYNFKTAGAIPSALSNKLGL